MSHAVVVSLFALGMLIGVAGSALPALPGIPLMFALALGFGILDGFAHLRGWELAVLFAITMAGLAVDYFAGFLGAKFGGAGITSMIYGMIGFVVGSITVPPFGGILGLFAGVGMGEFARHGEYRRALRAATGSALGTAAGILLGVTLSLLFLVLFVFFAWS